MQTQSYQTPIQVDTPVNNKSDKSNESTAKVVKTVTTTVHHVPNASVTIPPKSAVTREPSATAVIIVPADSHPRRPPGAPKGGEYRHIRYCGPLSILFCLLTELWCVAFCPCDTWYLYVAPDGSLWRADGAQVTPCLPYVRY